MTATEIINRQVQEQRRPEYIERLEKALLSGIFGNEVKDTREGAPEGSTILTGGILQEKDDEGFRKYFNVAPYLLAGQQGRDPETGAITGLGLETFAAQALSQDSNNDGIPDFMGRYSPYFETAGGAATGGIEALGRGLGTVGEAKTFFGPAAQYVSGGRGMYDPSQYVSQFMSPYTDEVIDEVEKDIERQGNVARNTARAKAVGAGAFGGSRQGVQAAEIERSILDAKSKAAADLRNKSYTQALAASQDAYQQGATRNLEAGRLMGGLGQSVGQLGSQFGSLGGQYGTLAGTTADIGRVYLSLIHI